MSFLLKKEESPNVKKQKVSKNLTETDIIIRKQYPLLKNPNANNILNGKPNKNKEYQFIIGYSSQGYHPYVLMDQYTGDIPDRFYTYYIDWEDDDCEDREYTKPTLGYDVIHPKDDDNQENPDVIYNQFTDENGNICPIIFCPDSCVFVTLTMFILTPSIDGKGGAKNQIGKLINAYNKFVGDSSAMNPYDFDEIWLEDDKYSYKGWPRSRLDEWVDKHPSGNYTHVKYNKIVPDVTNRPIWELRELKNTLFGNNTI